MAFALRFFQPAFSSSSCSKASVPGRTISSRSRYIIEEPVVRRGPVITNTKVPVTPKRSATNWNARLGWITVGSAGLCFYFYQELQKAKGSQTVNQLTAIKSLENPKFVEFFKDSGHLSYQEKRFADFASVSVEGKLFMTPSDFLESVISGAAGPTRPRLFIKDLDIKTLQELKANTPSLKTSSTRTFRNLGDKGIISYTEYLFLLSILTKPTAGFEIAFKMFDTDGDRIVDMQEFCVLLGLMCAKLYKESLVRGVDPSVLEKVFSRHLNQDAKAEPEKNPTIDQIQERKDEEERDKRTYEILHRSTSSPTTLLLHMFGKNGDETINFDQFSRFMLNLQTEVLELEFHEFSRGLKKITELDFAKIMLRYARLDPDRLRKFNERLLKLQKEGKFSGEGITFDEFRDFSRFLNNIDDFAMALKMYTLADKAISESEFNRAVKISSNLTLSEHLLHTVFLIFDEDGDGRLSHQEFLAILKDKLHRGEPPNQLKGIQRFKQCVRQEMRRTAL